MDAGPLLSEVARRLGEADLEAVLIGNAAAALHGAPVTTIDFDFLFRKSARNLAKLRASLGWLISSEANELHDDRATSPCWRSWRRRVRKPPSRKARLAAVARESERDLVRMIRRRLALPVERRTNFLRKRVGVGRSAL